MSLMTWKVLEIFRVEHWCKLLQRDSTDKQRESILQPLSEMTLSQDCTVDTSISELVEHTTVTNHLLRKIHLTHLHATN